MASNKRRKVELLNQHSQIPESHKTRNKWRSETEQRIYSTKLFEALRQVRRKNPSPRCREVHEAANQVLAGAAKGKTQWSRAILANRLKVSRLRRVKRAKVTGERLKKKAEMDKVEKRKKLPAVEQKVKILGKLIPGCRNIPVTDLLEEAGDYIAALEMQVRAMTMLAELLSGGAPAADGVEPDNNSPAAG